MKTTKTNTSTFKDLADEFKLLVCFDLGLETPRTQQAHLRIVDHWLEKNDKLLPQICAWVPQSAWAELDLPIAIKMAQLKLKHPQAPIPLKVILQHTYVDEISPQEGANLIKLCVPSLKVSDLEAFSRVLRDFLRVIANHSNGSSFKNETTDIVETFRVKCSELGREKVFPSFVSLLEFKSLTFVKPLLSQKAKTQSLTDLETELASLIGELKKKNISSKNLKALVEKISVEKMAKNPPLALLEEVKTLLVDENPSSNSRMTHFLQACATASSPKLKSLLPSEQSMAWYLMQADALQQKELVSLMAPLPTPKNYISTLLSNVAKNTISIDRGDDVRYIKKATRLINLFEKNSIKFTTFNSTIEHDNIYGWVDGIVPFPKTKKIQEAFTALASSCPSEVSSILSCLFTINNVQWQPPKKPSTFQIDDKDFRLKLKSLKKDVDDGDDYYLPMYEKTRHFLSLHERSLLLSQTGASSKQAPVGKTKKM